MIDRPANFYGVTLAALLLAAPFLTFADPAKPRWLPGTAYGLSKEPATGGEGYFAIIEGKNGRLYIGIHANAVNSWLVEFDPKAKKMHVAVDAHKAIGTNVK